MEESSYDGGSVTVSDYIRKYMVKNVYNAIDQTKDVDKLADALLAWYWLTRSRFFTCSPILRSKTPKPPPAGWKFIGAFTWDQIDEIFSYRGITLDYATS